MIVNEQGRTAQVIAWTCVLLVHAGLFWLLDLHERSGGRREDSTRMRLTFLERHTPPPAPSPSTSAKRPSVRVLPVPIARPVVTDDPTPAESAPAATPTTTTTGMPEPGPAWVQQPAPSFVPDPLRSRRARLPGGDRPESFRQREPLTPARVVGFVGMLFGNPGSPCPRIQQNLANLATATSDHGRELLEEEVRRDRLYCRP